MRNELTVATALAGTLLATCLISGSAQATSLPVLKSDATGIVTLVGKKGGGGHGGGHGHGGGGGKHHGMAVASTTVVAVVASITATAVAGITATEAVATITPTKAVIMTITTVTKRSRRSRKVSPLRLLRLVWPPIHLLRLWWRLRMAVSQCYKHRQFLLVEPLLRLHWLLLSLNGLVSA